MFHTSDYEGFDWDQYKERNQPRRPMALFLALVVAHASAELMRDAFYATYYDEAYADQWKEVLGWAWALWSDF